MTPNSLTFDHWIRNRFVELNTELELLYKNQNERINVNQVGDQIKKHLKMKDVISSNNFYRRVIQMKALIMLLTF